MRAALAGFIGWFRRVVLRRDPERVPEEDVQRYLDDGGAIFEAPDDEEDDRE